MRVTHIPLAVAVRTAVHTSSAIHLPTIVYLAAGSLLFLIACAATLRPVCDPDRAVIYRLATLHRVSGPGYVFVLPFIDRIDMQLDMGEHETEIVIRDGRTADGALVTPRLEATWRVHQDVRGRPSRRVRATLLLPDDRRVKLIDETVISATRSVLSKYTRSDLAHAGARESAMRMVEYTANDALIPCGLMVERVFWRI